MIGVREFLIFIIGNSNKPKKMETLKETMDYLNSPEGQFKKGLILGRLLQLGIENHHPIYQHDIEDYIAQFTEPITVTMGRNGLYLRMDDIWIQPFEDDHIDNPPGDFCILQDILDDMFTIFYAPMMVDLFPNGEDDCQHLEWEMISAGGDAESGPVTITQCKGCGKRKTQYGM